jgi:hypothetical protein
MVCNIQESLRLNSVFSLVSLVESSGSDISWNVWIAKLSDFLRFDPCAVSFEFDIDISDSKILSFTEAAAVDNFFS